MDNETSSEQLDLSCLEALCDAPGDGGFDVITALETAGLTFAEAQNWLLEARARGLVAEVDGSLVPSDRPTPEGRALVVGARRCRSDRSHLRRMAQRRLLAWADDTGGGNVLDFLRGDYAWIDGVTLTLAQAAEAAQALHEYGLIKARVTRAWGAGVVRADVELMPRGREVIDEYNGDVATWRASMARRDAVVNIAHNSGAVAIGGDGSTVGASVTNGIDADAVGRLVEALVAARGTLGLMAEDEVEYDNHLEDLQHGEPGRVVRALRWFGRLGRDISANALGGMLAAQAIGLVPG